VDVGPRSAHIAGCRYAAFCDEERFAQARLERFAPSAHDPADYVRFALRNGEYATLTPTCASNLLGYVPDGAFARGNSRSARAAFELLAQELGGEPEAHARRLLELAAEKVRACIETLIADYELPRERVVLIGGGGGAAALVPFVAERLGFDSRIARDAEVISPIGVALALVRDVVERTIVDPTPEDIVRIRREAFDRAVAAGASPDRIELSIEIDTQHSRVRATASGATAMAEDAGTAGELHVEKHGDECAIVDERGIVRLRLNKAHAVDASIADFEDVLASEVEERTAFGDVGRSLPDVYVIHGARITDLRGIASAAAVVALAKEEVAGLQADDAVTSVTVQRRA